MTHEHKPKIIEKHECGGHTHDDNHHHAHHGQYSDRKKERSRLKFVIWITGITMLVEIAGGIISGSLALISDAGHMFTHAFALLVSFSAIIIASKPPNMEKTFGYHRIEILAALFNSLTMVLITVWIFYQAYLRILAPVPVKGTEMLVIAVIGLIVNIISAIVLVGSTKGDLNLRSAFMHMIGDTASSVAIIIGAVVIMYTGYTIIDPLLSVLIAVMILIWSFNLVKESLHILLEAAPKNIDVKLLKQEIMRFPDVIEITDLHIWTITSNMYSLTVHIKVKDARISECKNLLSDINCMLDSRFDIMHTSIQLED